MAKLVRRSSLSLSFFLVSLVLACAAASWPGRAHADTMIDGGNVGGQTWTPSGSPYYLRGDVTVQAGGTLTIQAGTLVEIAPSDMQAAGQSAGLVELIVNGSLVVTGTAAHPVIFRGRSAATSGNFWWGIEIGSGAAGATIQNAAIQNASHALTSAMTASALSISNTAFTINAAGLQIQDGSATLDALTVGDSNVAVSFDSPSGTSTLTNSVIYGRTTANVRGVAVTAGTVHVANCTVDTFGTDFYLTGGTTDIINSIATNGDIGLDAHTGSPTVTVASSDLWNNASGNLSPSSITCSNCISSNPQYVSATDFHLQSTSVCIDAGAGPATKAFVPDHDRDGNGRPVDGDGIAGAAYDIGAYEFGSTAAGAGGAGGGNGAAGNAGTAGAGGAGGVAGTGGGAGAAGGATGTAGQGGGAGVAGAGGGAGLAGTGGVSGEAGSPGTAGSPGSGGMLASGGTTGSGGVAGPGTGGLVGTGGIVGTGGVIGTGGLAMGTGGVPAGAGGHAGAAGSGVTTLDQGCACAVDANGALPGIALPLFAALAIVIGRRRRR